MTTYFVTRHEGAVAWAKATYPETQHLPHLNIDILRAGDCIMGTLPVSMASEVCARGCRYLHLTLDLPAELRGQNLTAEDMQTHKARLEEFHIWRV